ncbi:MAG: site-specific integrase [Actinomycetota bacterium]|nr:site-specific integrase [Actinomycetota bacterium]
MTYIVQRRNLSYVVGYDGIDAISGKERRRWYPAGKHRDDAEQLARRLGVGSSRPALPKATRPMTVGDFLTETWLPRKRMTVRASTAYRYAWMTDKYIVPAIGTVALSALRADHLDGLYARLLATGGGTGTALAPKTVHEVHLVVRNALDLAIKRHLVDHNVAHSSNPPRSRSMRSSVLRTWTALQLSEFLGATEHQRLYPALHLTACTGMRRGEVAGLKWSDLDTGARRLSISRTLQNVGGRPTEFGVKTRTSRRCIDLDPATVAILVRWQLRLAEDGLPAGSDDWMFCNIKGRSLNPESISQLFTRAVARGKLPRIRYHDLRHTHASLLVAAGVPIKVVTERLGHAHPGFTMNTYQHVLPGMGALAATQFADLLDPGDGR